MANPYISTALELHTYVKSPETRYKSRPILGTLGLSIQKKDARWIFSFRHAGLRYHGSIGTYPQVSFKEAKSIFFKKRFAITEGDAPPRRIRRPRTASTADGTATKRSTPPHSPVRMLNSRPCKPSPHLQRCKSAVFPLSLRQTHRGRLQQTASKGCCAYGKPV